MSSIGSHINRCIECSGRAVDITNELKNCCNRNDFPFVKIKIHITDIADSQACTISTLFQYLFELIDGSGSEVEELSLSFRTNDEQPSEVGLSVMQQCKKNIITFLVMASKLPNLEIFHLSSLCNLILPMQTLWIFIPNNMSHKEKFPFKSIKVFSFPFGCLHTNNEIKSGYSRFLIQLFCKQFFNHPRRQCYIHTIGFDLGTWIIQQDIDAHTSILDISESNPFTPKPFATTLCYDHDLLNLLLIDGLSNAHHLNTFQLLNLYCNYTSYKLFRFVFESLFSIFSNFLMQFQNLQHFEVWISDVIALHIEPVLCALIYRQMSVKPNMKALVSFSMHGGYLNREFDNWLSISYSQRCTNTKKLIQLFSSLNEINIFDQCEGTNAFLIHNRYFHQLSEIACTNFCLNKIVWQLLIIHQFSHFFKILETNVNVTKLYLWNITTNHTTPTLKLRKIVHIVDKIFQAINQNLMLYDQHMIAFDLSIQNHHKALKFPTCLKYLIGDFAFGNSISVYFVTNHSFFRSNSNIDQLFNKEVSKTIEKITNTTKHLKFIRKYYFEADKSKHAKDLFQMQHGIYKPFDFKHYDSESTERLTLSDFLDEAAFQNNRVD